MVCSLKVTNCALTQFSQIFNRAATFLENLEKVVFFGKVMESHGKVMAGHGKFMESFFQRLIFPL